MKNTLIIITSIIAAGFYFDQDPHVIETVREVETIKEMTPLLVKPNINYVLHNVEIVYENTPKLVKPSFSPTSTPKFDYYNEMLNGVKFFEGFKPNAYYCCAGVKTIGYGETRKNIVSIGTITEHKASSLLENKLNDIRKQVEKEVKVPLNEAQLCALTSFTYNLGLGGLRELINKPNRLNDGNYESVERLLPQYRIAGGKVRKGLEKRRAWELSLWRGAPQIN